MWHCLDTILMKPLRQLECLVSGFISRFAHTLTRNLICKHTVPFWIVCLDVCVLFINCEWSAYSVRSRSDVVSIIVNCIAGEDMDLHAENQESEHSRLSHRSDAKISESPLRSGKQEKYRKDIESSAGDHARTRTQEPIGDPDRDQCSDGDHSSASFYSEDYENVSHTDRSLSSASPSPRRKGRSRRVSSSPLHRAGIHTHTQYTQTHTVQKSEIPLNISFKPGNKQKALGFWRIFEERNIMMQNEEEIFKIHWSNFVTLTMWLIIIYNSYKNSKIMYFKAQGELIPNHDE